MNLIVVYNECHERNMRTATYFDVDVRESGDTDSARVTASAVSMQSVDHSVVRDSVRRPNYTLTCLVCLLA